MRPIVSAASTVCMVEKTRWPDSAAWSAVSAVSESRSSPIRITSGSWRSARRSAWEKETVSIPTSRWLTMLSRSGMQHLDRVLDRDDVLLARLVDVVDHRRERRRLARAGRAGDEHEAAVLLGEPADAGRHVERLEARDLARDDAADDRDRSALAERVDAEARAGDLVADVELAARGEDLVAVGRRGRHRLDDLLEQRRRSGAPRPGAARSGRRSGRAAAGRASGGGRSRRAPEMRRRRPSRSILSRIGVPDSTL